MWRQSLHQQRRCRRLYQMLLRERIKNHRFKLSAKDHRLLRWESLILSLLVQVRWWKCWAISTDWNLVASSRFISTNLRFSAWRCSMLTSFSRLSGSSGRPSKNLLVSTSSLVSKFTCLRRSKKMWNSTRVSEVVSTPSWSTSQPRVLCSLTVISRTLTTQSARTWSTSSSSKPSERQIWSRSARFPAFLTFRIRLNSRDRSSKFCLASKRRRSKVSSDAR